MPVALTTAKRMSKVNSSKECLASMAIIVKLLSPGILKIFYSSSLKTSKILNGKMF